MRSQRDYRTGGLKSKAAVLGQEADDRRGHGLRVRDRNFGRDNPQCARAFERPAAEFQARLAARLATDDDLLERDAAPAGPERLHGRLLGREPPGHVLGAGPRATPSPQEFSRLEYP